MKLRNYKPNFVTVGSRKYRRLHSPRMVAIYNKTDKYVVSACEVLIICMCACEYKYDIINTLCRLPLFGMLRILHTPKLRGIYWKESRYCQCVCCLCFMKNQMTVYHRSYFKTVLYVPLNKT